MSRLAVRRTNNLISSTRSVGRLSPSFSLSLSRQERHCWSLGRRQLSLTTSRPRPSSLFTSGTSATSTTLIVGGYLVSLGYIYGYRNHSNLHCEAALISQPHRQVKHKQTALDLLKEEEKPSWMYQIYRAWRMFWRCCKLAVALAPIAAFSPILMLQAQQRDPSVKAQDIALNSLDDNKETKQQAWMKWYLRLCLSCVEASGAAVIKLLQWAGSRPDMFGHEFCAVFSQLQDHTTPHAWKHTEKALQEAFGPNWKEKIHIEPNELLGSGCIGQVYHGTINVGGKDKNTIQKQQVAVKVLHPNVQNDIDADLDLMRFLAYVADNLPFWKSLMWLNLPGAVEEFATLLVKQLDLRTEAAHLERFNENFAKEEGIVFPKLIPGFEPTADLLVETYVEGVPVMQFARDNQHDRNMLSDMCFRAIQCVCKMIFLDNFIHGDLHPGNIFVSPDGKDFILLDVGIVTEYSDADHQVIVNILGSFIRHQGRKAGQYMISDSNRRRGEPALDESMFLEKIDAIARDAADPTTPMMEQLGTYITQIFDAASEHHIMMNPAFLSAALAIKVQEGIAIALDPNIQMWKVATPIIVESERRRKVQSASKQMFGSSNKWFSGFMSKDKV